MTDAQLDHIEAELAVRLPADYRELSTAFPFRGVGRDRVYWFYDDPEAVINESRTPLCDGDYDGTGWRPSFVVIGQSACGDVYFIDTAAERSPVYWLSHETHEIEVERPDLATFAAEWLQWAEEAERRSAAERIARRIAARRDWGIVAGILFLCVLSLFGMWLLR